MSETYIFLRTYSKDSGLGAPDLSLSYNLINSSASSIPTNYYS